MFHLFLDDLILSKYRVNRKEAGDLETLVAHLKDSENHVKNSAINKLQVISEQVKFLQNQAKSILEEANRNTMLHNIPCNFVKIPGTTYHLYEKPSGEKYWSIITPAEWGSALSPNEAIGSYRVEYDKSFTPMDQIEEFTEHRQFAERLLGATSIHPAIKFISSKDETES